MRTRSWHREWERIERRQRAYRGMSGVCERFEAIENRIAEIYNGSEGLGELWMEVMKLSKKVEELQKRHASPRRRRSRRRSKRKE